MNSPLAKYGHQFFFWSLVIAVSRNYLSFYESIFNNVRTNKEQFLREGPWNWNVKWLKPFQTYFKPFNK